MNGFKSYSTYKDSGVPWIGAIPRTWEVKPFKWLLDNNDGGVWGNDPSGEDDTIVLRSTDQTVDGNWRVTDPAPRKLSAKEKASALLVEGDLVVTKSSGSALHIGKTTLVNDEIAKQGCCYGNFMQRLRVSLKFTPKLAWYVMNNELARAQLALLSNSTTGLANLNGALIGEILLPTTNVIEQVQIARFLDHETARIDVLIEEQQRLSELLKEKRQAMISHAVTKGIDPNASMKDSGVEWLGEAPSHWIVKSLKRLVEDGQSISYGIVQPGDHQHDGVPFIQTTNMSSGDFSLDSLQRTSPEIEASFPRSRLHGGEVILGIRATIGAAFVVSDSLKNINLSRGVARIECSKQILAGYLVYFLSSRGAFEYWGLAKQGSTFSEVSIATVRELPVTVPPLVEQEKIIDHLDQATKRVDELTLIAEQSMILLKERRSALISAAVTGKIDVRGWKPPANARPIEVAEETV